MGRFGWWVGWAGRGGAAKHFSRKSSLQKKKTQGGGGVWDVWRIKPFFKVRWADPLWSSKKREKHLYSWDFLKPNLKKKTKLAYRHLDDHNLKFTDSDLPSVSTNSLLCSPHLFHQTSEPRLDDKKGRAAAISWVSRKVKKCSKEQKSLRVGVKIQLVSFSNERQFSKQRLHVIWQSLKDVLGITL